TASASPSLSPRGAAGVGLEASQPPADATRAADRIRPLSSEPNLGQFARTIKYRARTDRFDLLITDQDLMFAVAQSSRGENPSPSSSAKGARAGGAASNAKIPGAPKARLVRLKLVGSVSRPHDEEAEPLPGRVNYFVGKDSSKWRRDIPTF